VHARTPLGDDWWRFGVLYHAYVRSFADSNGDGVGDLQGVIDHLDHLEWLGVDGLWLSPVTRSPNRDWGYDVSDYRSVQPELGDLGTLGRLIEEAGSRGVRVVLDLVPNHTSDQHAWFVDSRSSRGARHRGWYVWADPKADRSPPNNWVSVFGGPAWTLDEPTGQYYLHNFLPEQPDLNWWNEEVRDAFDRILRFWFERGVAGFRIDVAHGIVKDHALRENPLSTDEDNPLIRKIGQRQVYNMNRPEVHQVLRRWRAVAQEFDPPRVLIGETWAPGIDDLMRYYGSGTNELHLAFNFAPVLEEFTAEHTRAIVEATERALPRGAWPVWTGSNHDVGRFPTRWCEGDEDRIRCVLLALLTLRGTPFLYYGDEIGMVEVPVPLDRVRDPAGLRGWPDDPGRDPGRTPMQWMSEPGAGFTHPGVSPWLPVGDASSRNVRDQRSDPGSILTLCRDLIALRRSEPDLHGGRYESVESPPGVWSWRRGKRFRVVLNLTDRAARVDARDGTIAIGTHRDRDGERVGRRLSLRPWEGVVLRS
jgi:alpha-glucosidase